MVDNWIPYKQIPEDYKVVSIFPPIENGVFDYNSISIFKKLYKGGYLTNGTVKKNDNKAVIEDEYILNGKEYSERLFSYLSKEYMDSSLKLTQCVLQERKENAEGNDIVSSYANPCAFLCRHAIELKIKQCLCQQGHEEIKTHKLNELWQMLNKEILSEDVIRQLGDYIKEISQIDDNGESIRYGTGHNLLPINSRTDYDCIALVQNGMFLFNQLHKISFWNR